MTLTAQQVAHASGLRRLGATSSEIRTVLALTAEVDAILDLGHSEAWRTERRDDHGRFTRGGNALSMLAPHPEETPEHAKHTELQAQAFLATAKANSAQAQIAGLRKQQAESQQQIRDLMGAIRATNQKIATMAATEEHKKFRQRLAAHVGILLGAGALTAATSGLGTPALLAAGAAVGPTLISELVDFFKGL